MTNPDAGAKPKESWPLFVVAGLGFLPFLGIFFGAAGATWGLISSRRKAMLAALIAASGALLNIGGIVAFTIYNSSTPAAGEAKREFARHSMVGIVSALDAYHEKEHAYPFALDSLPSYHGFGNHVLLIDQTAGPFHGNPEYQYRVAPDGESYDLFAVGKDNKPGTADDIRPVLPDSIKARTGFRPATSAEQK
ncbi:MAG: type II secretion system protein GspG [Gemmatimonadota bacterium]